MNIHHKIFLWTMIISIILILFTILTGCSYEDDGIGLTSTDPFYVSYPTVSVNVTATPNLHASTHEASGTDPVENFDEIYTPLIFGSGSTYVRIGDANTTSHGFSSEDDLLITGKLEVNANAYFDTGFTSSHATFLDDSQHGFGNNWDARITYEQSDTDARSLNFNLPHTSENANNVPLAIFGDNDLWNTDLGFFDGVTQPKVALIDQDRDHYISIGHYSDDQPAIETNSGNISFYINSNLCMYLTDDGTLYVDSTYESFDEYDDAILLRDTISTGDLSQLVDIGIATPKYNTTETPIIIGYEYYYIDGVEHTKNIYDYSYTKEVSGYQLNFQKMVNLLAGGIYQNREKIDLLEERIKALEK